MITILPTTASRPWCRRRALQRPISPHGCPIYATSIASRTEHCSKLGVGVLHFRDGYEPHGDSPYELTPELPQGSYFENLVSHSQREEAKSDSIPAPAIIGRDVMT